MMHCLFVSLVSCDRALTGETDTMAEITALILNFLKAIGKYRWHAVIIAWVVALVGWAVVSSCRTNMKPRRACMSIPRAS